LSSQIIYSLAAACFGFVSAVFFAVGSAFLSQSKAVAQARTYWGFNTAYAEAIVSQSAQYAVGALLLFFAFLFQVVAALASPTIPHSQCPVLSSAWLFVPAVLTAVGFPSWLACRWLTKWRLAKVLVELPNGGDSES
jgi:hypothetical protein